MEVFFKRLLIFALINVAILIVDIGKFLMIPNVENKIEIMVTSLFIVMSGSLMMLCIQKIKGE